MNPTAGTIWSRDPMWCHRSPLTKSVLGTEGTSAQGSHIYWACSMFQTQARYSQFILPSELLCERNIIIGTSQLSN